MEEDEIIQIDTVLKYEDGGVKVKRMITNGIPAKLLFDMIEALNKTIKRYYEDAYENI